MKRILSILLVLSMVLSMVLAFSACNKDDEDAGPTYAEGTTQGSSENIDLSSFDGKKLQPYLQMIIDKNYYAQMSGTMASGSDITMTYIRIGEDEKVSLDGDYSFVLYNGKFYLVSEQQMGYYEVTSSLESDPTYASDIEKVKSILVYWEALMANMVFLYPTAGTGTTIQGVASHEEYIDLDTQDVFSFFFDTTGSLMGFSQIDTKTKQSQTTDFVMGTPQASAISGIFSQYKNLGDETTTAASTVQ